MINIFLSASVPLPERNRAFFETSDVLAIREAIKALVEVVLPMGRITCGGHPAITPLLALFAREAGLDSDRIVIYQSDLFRAHFPPEISDFLNVQTIPAIASDRTASLTAMRRSMIASQAYDAAVIVGGMEGIFEELRMFEMFHPQALVIPLPTTGAAAAVVYDNGNYDPGLKQNRTFSSLFRRQLRKITSRDS